jgi:thermitase
MKALRIILPAVIIIASLAVVLGVGAANDSAAVSALPIMVMPAQDTDAGAGLNDAVAASPEPFVPNDPYLDRQWALGHIQIEQLWQTAGGGAGVVVAVLDTGIDSGHEDLEGKVAGEANFSGSKLAGDVYGHGTHIAGIIAAQTDNGLGIAGVAPQSLLLNVKVADDSGQCTAATVAQGIIWAVDNGAEVINVSIEIRQPLAALEEATSYAWEHGAIVIAAAGNDGNQTPVYPAYYENVIAVAATNPDDTLAVLSNYGDWVDMAAPGYKIYSTLPGNEYGYKTGTSFATAYVSGLAAILFGSLTDSNGNGYLNDEVMAALENGCQPAKGFKLGYGLIDAASLAGD